MVRGPKKDRWHPLFTTAVVPPMDVLPMFRSRQHHEQAYRVGGQDEALDAAPSVSPALVRIRGADSAPLDEPAALRFDGADSNCGLEYTRPGQRLRVLLRAVMVAAGRVLWQGRELARSAGAQVEARAAPAERASGRKRCRVVSDFRCGWHEALTEVAPGSSVLRQAILAAQDMTRRIQQRPQVIGCRKPLPTKNRHRTRLA